MEMQKRLARLLTYLAVVVCGAAGVEPWVSDGTSAGTHLLKDINPAGNSNPSWFDDFSGVTLFEVTDPTNGEQLWRTDGTSLETILISTIPSLVPTSFTTAARHRLTVGQQFFFSAKDPILGTELYALTNMAPVAVADSSTSSNDAAIVAVRLLLVMAEPFDVVGEARSVHCSIGVAEFPRDAADATSLLGASLAAADRAQLMGGGQYRVASDSREVT